MAEGAGVGAIVGTAVISSVGAPVVVVVSPAAIGEKPPGAAAVGADLPTEQL